MSPMMIAGIPHFKNCPVELGGGTISRFSRLWDSFSSFKIPDRCPAPTTATKLVPGAWRIFSARYWSRSSIRVRFMSFESDARASIASDSASPCFNFSTSSWVISSLTNKPIISCPNTLTLAKKVIPRHVLCKVVLTSRSAKTKFAPMRSAPSTASSISAPG